ncbi:winged helix-turn-helix domain-containing protein [Alkalihalobacillus sp. TS-13]|uniref:winged helix-turn-helix domain-containing protein n=1 Tax=Alkalihalobacillus sp. TS-13 TaxID=2842455 RepID=UPI001C875BA1|nr:crosslink repair DNA glycosylase YcaQ family protein [Alkalihalobacillus sp. TS-13]
MTNTTFSVDKIALRRFLLSKQALLGLEQSPVPDPLHMVKKLECVQLDPVSVVERNQHLVLAARIPGYDPKQLDDLLEEGKVFEYFANAACVIPIEDFPMFKPTRERIQRKVAESLEQLGLVVDAVIEQLKSEGPLPSRAFQSEKRVHGYWDNKTPKTKETSLALNLLLDSGVIRVVRRDRTERYFDITERTVGADLLKKTKAMDETTARALLIEKYLRAYRVFDPRDARFGWQKLTAAERREEVEKRVASGSVTPLEIDGVKRQYYMLTKDLDELGTFVQDVRNRDSVNLDDALTFLPPLDNLLWSRDRIKDLFDFDYKWEIYTPRMKRKYGPYAMPILWGDRLIGRMDPQIDRKNGVLIVRLLQLEPWVEKTTGLQIKLREALEKFAVFNCAADVRIENSDVKMKL